MLSLLLLGLLVLPTLTFPLEQPVLTFGDTTEEITMSVVTSGQSDIRPIVFLHNIATGEERTLESTHSRQYTKLIDLDQYSRLAYFFTTQITRNVQYEWAAELNGFILGPYPFIIRSGTETGDTKILYVADMDHGVVGVSTVRAMIHRGLHNYDMLIHGGDFAYDVNTNSGKNGDEFFQSMSGITARLPYIITPGNHENFDNAELFNYRFRMPNYSAKFDNNIYAFRKNNVLFFLVNFDAFLYLNKWTYNEIVEKAISLFETYKNDRRIKWRVAINHRPIYCGWYGKKECLYAPLYFKAFEDIYLKYKVDTVLSGHEHIYERMMLFKDWALVKGVEKKEIPLAHSEQSGVEYTNLPVPVYIVNGLSGTKGKTPMDLTDQIFPINENHKAGSPLYTDLRITEHEMEIKTIYSVNGSIADHVRIVRSAPPGFLSRIPSYVYSIFIAVVVTITLFIVQFMYFKNEQAKRLASHPADLTTPIHPDRAGSFINGSILDTSIQFPQSQDRDSLQSTDHYTRMHRDNTKQSMQ